jgi:peptidoglycan LD-endopeptidase LytH
VRKAALGAISFVALTTAALASMVRFTGPEPPAPEPAPPSKPAVALTITIPVEGVAVGQLTDTWGQSRGGGARAHQGIDIMAPRGRPVRAYADGIVEKLFVSRAGGITLYQRSDDRRWIYYYAHLDGYAPGIVEGMRLKAGQTLGYVGDSGNAGPGNTHLHFAINRMQPGEPWYRGEAVNPYPLLVSGR